VGSCDIGPFSVWVTGAERAPTADLDRIEQHHQVVMAAVSLTTPVPVRFGAWTPSERVLSEHVLERQSEIETALRAVDGMVEFGVRVVSIEPAGTPDVPDPPAGGRAYMQELSRRQEARRRRKAEQATVLTRLRSHLGDLGHDERVRFLEAPGLVAVAHLVEREVETRYRRSMEAFAREAPEGHRVHLTGPWPPYSFAAS